MIKNYCRLAQAGAGNSIDLLINVLWPNHDQWREVLSESAEPPSGLCLLTASSTSTTGHGVNCDQKGEHKELFKSANPVFITSQSPHEVLRLCMHDIMYFFTPCHINRPQLGSTVSISTDPNWAALSPYQ